MVQNKTKLYRLFQIDLLKHKLLKLKYLFFQLKINVVDLNELEKRYIFDTKNISEYMNQISLDSFNLVNNITIEINIIKNNFKKSKT